MTFTDPTDDMLTTFNEIMFRISLAAFRNSSNSSQTTFYTMAALEPVITVRLPIHLSDRSDLHLFAGMLFCTANFQRILETGSTVLLEPHRDCKSI